MTYLILSTPNTSNKELIRKYFQQRMGVNVFIEYDTLISKMSSPMLFHNSYNYDESEIVINEFIKNFNVDIAPKEFKESLNKYYELIDYQSAHSLLKEKTSIAKYIDLNIINTKPKICKFLIEYLKWRNYNRKAVLFVNDLNVFAKLADFADEQLFSVVILKSDIQSFHSAGINIKPLVDYLISIENNSIKLEIV